MRRRQLIRAACLSGAVGVTGCLGSGDDEASPGDDSSADSQDGDSSDDGSSADSDGQDGDSADDGSSADGQDDPVQVDGVWRTFQGDSTNTGTGNGATGGPAGEPSVEWTVTADDEVWGDPIIVDGVVLAGSWDNTLYAVSLSSGEKRWTYETPDSLSFPAAAVSGTVFIGSGTAVAALDIETGEPYWTTTTDARVRGGPVVADGFVYVPTRENLTALSVGDGEQQWEVRTGGPVASTPHVSDGVVYFTSADGNIYAADTDGEVVWQQRISNQGGFPSPTVVDGTVFFGWGDGTMYALDAADGTEQWTDKTGGAEVVAVDDGVVYIAGYPLTAIDTDTQESRWTTEEPEGRPTNFTVGEDRVYLGTQEARILAYDRESGDKRWQFQGDYAVTTSVAISDGRLVYGDEFGNLVALS